MRYKGVTQQCRHKNPLLVTKKTTILKRRKEELKRLLN